MVYGGFRWSLLLVGLYLSPLSTIEIYRIIFVIKSKAGLDLDCGVSVFLRLFTVIVHSFYTLF